MKIRFLFAVALLISTLFVGVGTASADSRCNGNPGHQIWEHINKGGNSAKGCLVGWYRSDFGSWHDNLPWPQSWNDRASSVETFNFLGHSVIFYNNANKVIPKLTLTDDTYIENLGD